MISNGEGNGTPLQYCCLENPMDRGAWKAAVHGVAEGRIWLSDFPFTFHFSLSCIGEGNDIPLQCSCLENPRDGGAWWLPSMGSHRVGHDWSDLAAAADFWCRWLHWWYRRQNIRQGRGGGGYSASIIDDGFSLECIKFVVWILSRQLAY